MHGTMNIKFCLEVEMMHGNKPGGRRGGGRKKKKKERKKERKKEKKKKTHRQIWGVILL